MWFYISFFFCFVFQTFLILINNSHFSIFYNFSPWILLQIIFLRHVKISEKYLLFCFIFAKSKSSDSFKISNNNFNGKKILVHFDKTCSSLSFAVYSCIIFNLIMIFHSNLTLVQNYTHLIIVHLELEWFSLRSCAMITNPFF